MVMSVCARIHTHAPSNLEVTYWVSEFDVIILYDAQQVDSASGNVAATTGMPNCAERAEGGLVGDSRRNWLDHGLPFDRDRVQGIEGGLSGGSAKARPTETGERDGVRASVPYSRWAAHRRSDSRGVGAFGSASRRCRGSGPASPACAPTRERFDSGDGTTTSQFTTGRGQDRAADDYRISEMEESHGGLQRRPTAQRADPSRAGANIAREARGRFTILIANANTVSTTYSRHATKF